jgi:hypothetical protein
MCPCIRVNVLIVFYRPDSRQVWSTLFLDMDQRQGRRYPTTRMLTKLALPDLRRYICTITMHTFKSIEWHIAKRFTIVILLYSILKMSCAYMNRNSISESSTFSPPSYFVNLLNIYQPLTSNIYIDLRIDCS